MINALLLSVGSKLHLIDYFKQELKGCGGKVFTVDSDKYAPALYRADEGIVMEGKDEDLFIENILSLCRKGDIKICLTCIDGQGKVLARHLEKFKKNGILCVTSGIREMELFEDKLESFKKLSQNGFKAPFTSYSYKEIETLVRRNKISFPLILKDRYGSASSGLMALSSLKETKFFLRDSKNVVIQEYIKAQEYGADIYSDFISGEVITVVTRKKIKMKNGETDKAITVYDSQVDHTMRMLAKVFELKGPIDVDLFKINNEIYIIDVNPRFGGGYTLAHQAGANFMKMIITNAQGIPNEPEFQKYQENKVLMKFTSAVFVDGDMLLNKADLK